MQITENAWQVGGSGLTAPADAAIYLIRFGEAAALIDAGCGDGTQTLLALARARGAQDIHCSDAGEVLEIEFLLPD